MLQLNLLLRGGGGGGTCRRVAVWQCRWLAGWQAGIMCGSGETAGGGGPGGRRRRRDSSCSSSALVSKYSAARLQGPRICTKNGRAYDASGHWGQTKNWPLASQAGRPVHDYRDDRVCVPAREAKKRRFAARVNGCVVLHKDLINGLKVGYC